MKKIAKILGLIALLVYVVALFGLIENKTNSLLFYICIVLAIISVILHRFSNK